MVRHPEVQRFADLFAMIPDEQIVDFIGIFKEMNDRIETILKGG